MKQKIKENRTSTMSRPNLFLIFKIFFFLATIEIDWCVKMNDLLLFNTLYCVLFQHTMPFKVRDTQSKYTRNCFIVSEFYRLRVMNYRRFSTMELNYKQDRYNETGTMIVELFASHLFVSCKKILAKRIKSMLLRFMLYQ